MKVNWTSQDGAKLCHYPLSGTSLKLDEQVRVRDIFKIPLPSISTIQRFASKFKCASYRLQKSLSLISVESKSMEDFENFCVLNFDETITQAVEHCKSFDVVIRPHANVQCTR